MANSVLDLPQPIIGIKYLYIQKMFPLSKALEMSLNIICLRPKSDSDLLFSCSCIVALFCFASLVSLFTFASNVFINLITVYFILFHSSKT